MSKTIFSESPNNDIKFTKQTFTQFINERSFDTNNDIAFDTCIFKETAIFENITAREFFFYDCTFEKGLYIGKSIFHNLTFISCNGGDIDIFSNEADNLSFRLTKANELRLNGNYYSTQFVSSIIKELKIIDLNSIQTYRESKLEFLKGNDIAKIRLNNVSFHSEIFFISGNYSSIIFEGEYKKRITFSNDVKIYSLHFESANCQSRIDFEEGVFDYIYFHRSSFQNLVYFNDLSVIEKKTRNLTIKEISLHSCNFNKDVTVHINKINYLNISNCNFQEVFNFNNSNYSIENIEMLMISLDGIIQGSLIFEKGYADFSLTGINLGNLYLKDLKTHTIYMSDFQNNGILSLSNIISGVHFVIKDTISGKINFLNWDINIFREIIIVNSNIEGANFNIYPKKILSLSRDPRTGYGINERSKRIINLKNVYNQLKQVAKKNGDIDMSNRFAALEQKQLLISKKIGFDSFLLLLNFMSNNSGNSWSRGILFTLIIGLIFFNLYMKTLGIKFDLGECYQDYIRFISSFPILELKEYKNLNENWLTQLTLWLSRIFISYGIYQTIAAFRKYGKT